MAELRERMTMPQDDLNVLELRALQSACVAFLSVLWDPLVQILMDNMFAVHYVKRHGGSESSPLCQNAIGLWTWCHHHGLTPLALYLPGMSNNMADF